MKHGARNSVTGVIKNIKKGTVMAQVDLSEIDADSMSSVMTLDSLDAMDIKEGDKVKIIVKAVNVLLVKE